MACSYGYKLVYVDDKSFKSYLGQDAIYNFINSMIKKSKYCTDILKKHFNKVFATTKKENEILKTLLNVGFAIMFTLKVML